MLALWCLFFVVFFVLFRASFFIISGPLWGSKKGKESLRNRYLWSVFSRALWILAFLTFLALSVEFRGRKTLQNTARAMQIMVFHFSTSGGCIVQRLLFLTVSGTPKRRKIDEKAQHNCIGKFVGFRIEILTKFVHLGVPFGG
jgi:hypothetical protein